MELWPPENPNGCLIQSMTPLSATCVAIPCPQVLRIPELGLQGGAQLAADAEYFNNVMSALHGAPPAALLTVQVGGEGHMAYEVFKEDCFAFSERMLIAVSHRVPHACMQLFAGQPPDVFIESAAQAAADGGADMSVLRALAGMRKLAIN